MSIFDYQLKEQQLDSLYNWIDNLPLSRPKRNINRDFSDGVLMAQTINHYFPKIIQLHNYPSTNSIKSKIQNWRTLNMKVLNKLGINLRNQDCQKLASSTPMMVETLLCQFKKLCAEEDRSRMMMINQTQNSNNNNTNSPSASNIQMSGYNYNRQSPTGYQNVDKQMQGNKSPIRKKQTQFRGFQVTKVEELKQILRLLKQKIAFVQKNLQRKQAQIKQLQDLINLGI